MRPLTVGVQPIPPLLFGRMRMGLSASRMRPTKSHAAVIVIKTLVIELKHQRYQPKRRGLIFPQKSQTFWPLNKDLWPFFVGAFWARFSDVFG